MSNPKLQDKIIEALKTVQDPDLHKDIVSLGFVKNLELDGSNVKFDVELTTPACPVKEQLKTECETKVQAIEGVENVTVNMTAVVQPTQHSQPVLKGVKNIIAVASGKGGVGKSTVSTNLAIALSMTGAKIGLMDADIYGPSIPQMMGIPITSPKVAEENKFYPHEKYGLKVVSAAFLTKQGQPLMLRGPMLGGIIQQFLQNVVWGELDYLILDLPPGTGDIQLTLVQKVALTGAIIVTTPQDLAHKDVQKGSDMFKKVNTPVIGIVENMSFLNITGQLSECGNNPKIIIDGIKEKIKVNEDGYFESNIKIFKGKSGLQESERLNIPMLGSIPLDPNLSLLSDLGKPCVFENLSNQTTKSFSKISSTIIKILSKQTTLSSVNN